MDPPIEESGQIRSLTQINGPLHLLKLTDDPREKLKALLGRHLRVKITDGRYLTGTFVCTDRDGNIILEDSLEISSLFEGE